MLNYKVPPTPPPPGGACLGRHPDVTPPPGGGHIGPVKAAWHSAKALWHRQCHLQALS